MVLQSLLSLRSILGEKYNIFLFQVHSLVQDWFNEDCPTARCKSRNSPRKGRRKMKKERKKKRRAKTCFELFFLLEKNGDCSRKFRRHQDSGHDSSVCRPIGFAAQDQSSKCRFHQRSALQTSPYDVRKTTKICTTCTYYREILTVWALRSSRTIEYYVLLSLRTIEKRKDWI